MEKRTVPCEICSKPTPMRGTKRCDNCWEVERRLETYLQSEAGQSFVAAQLAKLGWACVK